MKNQIINLKNELERELINCKDLANPAERLMLAVAYAQQTLLDVQALLNKETFADEAEQIDCFKNGIPAIAAELLYYSQLQRLEVLSPESFTARELYHKQELKKVQAHLKENAALVKYLDAGDTSKDREYFLPAGDTPPSDLLDFTCGSRTELVARISAAKRLSAELEARLSGEHQPPIGLAALPKLCWTGAKIQLVELAYGLKLSGMFNEGKATVQEILTVFEYLFNIRIIDPYDTFCHKIRYREGKKTRFMDLMAQKINERLDLLNGVEYKPR